MLLKLEDLSTVKNPGAWGSREANARALSPSLKNKDSLHLDQDELHSKAQQIEEDAMSAYEHRQSKFKELEDPEETAHNINAIEFQCEAVEAVKLSLTKKIHIVLHLRCHLFHRGGS